MSIMFHEICINEEMLPIYIYIYILREVVGLICVCVCVCVCVRTIYSKDILNINNVRMIFSNLDDDSYHK